MNLHEWKTWGLALLQSLQGFVGRQHRALTATVLVVSSAFAVTAFGLAPLVDAAAPMAVQRVEALPAPELQSQIEALADFEVPLQRHDRTRPGDNADSLLARLGAFDPRFAAYLRQDVLARQLFQGRTGKRVALEADASGKVQRLVARFPAANPQQEDTHFSRLVVERTGSGLRSQVEQARFETQMRLASGTIETSLFGATDEAGLPDAVASQLAEMFAGDIDFHREIKRGDRFALVYETLTADGEPITWGEGSGRVLAAEFVNAGRVHQALWHKDAGTQKAGYYAFDGKSKRRAFLASPMAFSRVTSGFAMRLHPLLQTWRKHNGVDYGAPTGTPVRSVGDGVVDRAGRQGGYGNVVVVRHGGGKETLYAHLSRIDVRAGQRIEQGQRIGAVGATGWATGPHLHFEFRVNNQHVNPRALAKASDAVPLSPASVKPFMEQVAAARTRLQLAASVEQGVLGAH